MICVQYDRAGHSVAISGHAEAGEYGHDVVCAAVSGLAYTLAGCAEQLYAKGLADDAEISLCSGNAAIRCIAAAGFDCTVNVVFDTICYGLQQLAENFPEFLTFFCGQTAFNKK